MQSFKNGLIAAALTLFAHGSAPQAAFASPASANVTGEWTRIDAKPVRIKGRLFTPTCSGAPGADPAFAFWFQKGSADGLMVFFQGGGACWNDATCSQPRLAGDHALFKEKDGDKSLYEAELLPDVDPSRMNGLFDRTEENNPVRDWSKIFVPYCTGDVHSGSNTAHYRDPATGKPFTIQHRGWDNMQVVMHWMRANAPQPARLLVAGSSAGAYGAATHFTSLRNMYPKAASAFLGDAGQGVTTPEFEQARNVNWNYQLPTSVFGRDAQRTPDAETVGRLAAHFPQDRFAQYTTVHDATQTAFYALMGGPRTCDAWTNKMTQELSRRQTVPNFHAYLAEGDAHTILRQPRLYAEQSAGVAFTQWLGTLLGKDPLENKSCATCMAKIEHCP